MAAGTLCGYGMPDQQAIVTGASHVSTAHTMSHIGTYEIT